MTGRHAAPAPGPRHAGREAGRHADPDRGEVYQARHGVNEPVHQASCGHPSNEDGECDCSWWPEPAPFRHEGSTR